MDILKKLSEQGYRPYSFTDCILVEIYNKLCDIENKLEKQQEAIPQSETIIQELIPETKPDADIKPVIPQVIPEKKPIQKETLAKKPAKKSAKRKSVKK